MRYSSYVLGALCLSLACAGLPAAAQTAAALRLKPVYGLDSTGFEKPMPAFSMLVPHDWQSEGGIIWNPNDRCNTSGYNFSFKAVSPDNAFGIVVLPTVTWQAHFGAPPQQMVCPALDFRSARAFLEWYVGQMISSAQVLDYRPRPDLLQNTANLVSHTPLGNGAYNETAVDAGELQIAFVDSGRTMHALVAAVVTLWHSHIPGMAPMIAGVPGLPDKDIFGGSSWPSFAAFAPQGQLDTRAAELIRKSFQTLPEWSGRIAEHNGVISRQNIKGATERHNIRMQTIRDVSDIMNKGYQERAASQDRRHRRTIEMIRGVQSYEDPYHGGTVQLDNTYNHAWQLDDGTYVLTDSVSFNPYEVFGRQGQELKAVE